MTKEMHTLGVLASVIASSPTTMPFFSREFATSTKPTPLASLVTLSALLFSSAVS